MNPGTHELVGLLWKATDLLHANGAMIRDSAARYVFRLLLLKFLSDVAEGPSTSDLPRFEVPPSAQWSQLGNHLATELGDRVNKACAILEEANPSLEGLLTETDFNSVRLGARLLAEVYRMFSALPHLSGELVSEGKLGEVATDYLRQLAERSGRTAGEFYTPPSVGRLMAELLEPQAGMSICDPACGVGGFLVECTRRLSSRAAISLPHAAASLRLYGQERNAEMWALCRMNLLLHGIGSADIELGNVLWRPPMEQGHLLRYDRILANPPWNLGDWGAERAEEDPFGRFSPVPPKNNANYAYVQHCLAALKEGGKAALVLPRGVLLRSGIEEMIRRKLLEEDRIEAVIGLPGGLLYGTGVPPVILVLTKGKPAERRKHVLFIDASEAGAKHRRQLHTLPQDTMSSIVRAFRDFGGDPRSVRVARLEEIRALNWNLTIERYVERTEKRERFDLGEHLDVLTAAERQRDEAARRMDDAVSRLKRFYLPDDSSTGT